MTVNAVRLNHAVLFVADLERSIAFYQQAFDMTVMAREPRANAAFLRLPRSGNHHDLGLFGVGAQPPRPRGSLGLYHLAWQVDTIEELEEARLTLANLGAFTGESSHGATKSVYGRDPDGNEFEVMWMLPKAQLGRVRERRPGRAARPARRGRAGGPASAPPPSWSRWTRHDQRGLRAAGRRDVRQHRPVRAPGRPAARPRLQRAARSSAWPRTSRRDRRTPRCGHRSPRAAGTPGSPTAASVARSPSRCRSTMGWFRELARRGRPGRAGRWCWSASAAAPRSPAGWSWTTPRATPARRSSTAPCRSTPASRPTAGRLANLPVFVAQGDADHVIPRELLDRTWAYLLAESGAPTVAHRQPGGHQLTAATTVRQLGDWIAHRLAFGRPPRPAPAPGPRSDVRGRTIAGGGLPARRGPRPDVSWTIPQQQQTQNAPAGPAGAAVRRGPASCPAWRSAHPASPCPARGRSPS